MLGSITPLGERGRGQRWWVTFLWFVAGALAGGTLIGAALGAVGQALDAAAHVPVATRAVALAVLASGAALWDIFGPFRLPTTLRQVNAYWIGRYRGWVVGVGFGFQLGLGVGTVITTALVYAALGAAVLASSIVGGALIMGCFGLARALALAPAGWITTPQRLLAINGWLAKNAPRMQRAAAAAAGAVSIIVLLFAL